MNRVRFVNRNRRSQSGIGMIEVLITLLVISFGFLGIAALQARALSTNGSASARSAATLASYSILDAMRADAINAKKGAYNEEVTANACPDAGTDLASVQLNAWCGQLGQALGTAATTAGTINCSDIGDCTVTIQFDDSRSGTDAGSSGAQQVVTRTQL